MRRTPRRRLRAGEPGAATHWRAAGGRWPRASFLLPFRSVSATVALVLVSATLPLGTRRKPRRRGGRRLLHEPGRKPVLVLVRAPAGLAAPRRDRSRRRCLRLWPMATRLAPPPRGNAEQLALGGRRFRNSARNCRQRSRRRAPHDHGPSRLAHLACLCRRR